VPLGLRKFAPIRPSPGTIRFFETLQSRDFVVGGVSWTGWSLGDDDVWVLEERGHSPDHLWFYVPACRFLHTGDSTYDILTIWPDTDGDAIRASIAKAAAMVRSDTVSVLTDGHHHRIYRGEEILSFLEGILEADHRFRELLLETVSGHAGITVPEIYTRLQELPHEAVVRTYSELEFPHAPGTLQAIITSTLLELGCSSDGPRGRRRFHPPPPFAG
jgi:glyoxylase-like metal-dependent hydrolase (beta-lactamase superfamily II)